VLIWQCAGYQFFAGLMQKTALLFSGLSKELTSTLKWRVWRAGLEHQKNVLSMQKPRRKPRLFGNIVPVPIAGESFQLSNPHRQYQPLYR
jgi:hypothetical protein